ncbi:glycosyltransferase [Anaerolineales bacterium HSG24]|nr:glycosyltransferase [Anaerolineales bacterium HSG24]
MKKIIQVISGLDTGGAEIMLYRLLGHIDRTKFEVEVISLTDIGPTGKKIVTLGIPVFALGMKRGVLPNPIIILRLTCLLRQQRPHVIQTWLYHADLIGGLAAKLAGNIPICWGIHISNLDAQLYKQTTYRVISAGAKLSRWLPTRIVICSQVAQQPHIELGYVSEKMVFIPNGFDLEAFKPNPTARVTLRQELDLPPDTPLVGLIARFDPQKGHYNFIKAAEELHFHQPDVKFLLCGKDITWDNKELVQWIDAANLQQTCYLLGRRDDIPRLQAGLDILTLSSHGEAFPLVVGEAMACGIPCVVTDVGDSALIVGKTGRVVPPSNPTALAQAWRQLLALPYEARRIIGQQARQRISENFEIGQIAKQYARLWESVA